MNASVRDSKAQSGSLNRGKSFFVIVIVLLLMANIVTVGFLVYSYLGREDSVQQFVNEYPLLDPARNFVAQKHFIVNVQPLREDLQALVKEFGESSVSLYVEFLNTGANIAINPDIYIWPASLAKVPLAMAVMKKIEAGDWNLGNELVLLPGDRNEESGSEDSPLSEYPFGTRFTIEALLEELLINSDNTAYYMLIRNIHADELNQIVDDLGFDALFSDDGKVSAKEYSRMFRALYNASYLTREHSEMILEWLDESTFDDYLSHDLSKETRFPHKYGEKIDLRVYLDSGIVYLPNRPYLITVMVNGQPGELLDADRERAIQFMRGVSKKVYDYFTAD
ncbi:MAG: hypothetical protein A3B31_01235 [Candidatus Komeilibacteria bacterium RIFCSPLOWO2_01_FULL_53_11]|uniref:Beta-lactamase class A catalytic domain-containing protein n=1 Tax=Candidatus Komeilibacteria bacterium RIFCSPLOWO2_01_FULL_53_11 TaxID=1798552 RepID=A0A1G2BQT9_9BACT|nr:MAG: hypothetical protein A3B31_01235 [Candidatus Komeilibacteria bacterium RIFCSPLOWO2_01_FULL_53_11]